MDNALFQYEVLEQDIGLAKAGTIQIVKLLGVDENGTVAIPVEIDGIPVTSLKVSSSGIVYQKHGKWIVTKIRKLIIPSSLVDIQRPLMISKLLPTAEDVLIVSEDNPCFSSDGISLLSKDGKTMLDQVVSTVERYSVPEGVECIEEYAFERTKTVSIYLPDSVKIIKNGAFDQSEALKEITGGYGLQEIGIEVFSECPFVDKPYLAIGNTLIKCLTTGSEYTVPEGIEYIAGHAFCESNEPDAVHLQRIHFPASLKHLGNYALDGLEGLIEADLPDGLIKIGSSAFRNTGIKKVHIPTSVSIIGNGAFSGCSSLEEVIFAPSTGICTDSTGTHGIAAGLFYNCTAIKKIILPDGIRSIGSWAFNGCVSLETVSLPETLETIDDFAFGECKELKEIRIPARVEDISSTAFAGSPCIVQVDNSAGDARCGFIDGVLFTKLYEKLALFPADLQKKTYVVPVGVKEIAKVAFANNPHLVSVSLPDSVRSIEEGAFEGCGALESATLPETLTALPKRLFCGCRKLNNAPIPRETKVIGEECFANTALKTIFLPDQVEQIGNYAFEGVAVDCVTLPPSVKKIGISIFPMAKEITIYDSLAPDAKPAGTYFDDANGFYGDTNIGSMGIFQKRRYVIAACSSQWNDHMIIVRSAKTGSIKYKVWMGGSHQPRNVYCSLASSWGAHADFAFDLLDNQVFAKMKSSPDKQKTAVLRILWPERLSDAVRKRYISYINRNAMDILMTCVEEDRLDVLTALEPLKILKAEYMDKLCNAAVKLKRIQIAAWLMEYRQAHFAEALQAKAMLGLDDNLAAAWKFTKKKEGIIGAYMGEDSYVVFPREVDGKQVLGIGGVVPGKLPDNYQEIEAIEIPEGYLSIGQYAFSGCAKLKKVILPDSIREIGKGAFANCTALESIRMPASLKNINTLTFKNCTVLKEVEIHNSFDGFIGKEAFANCQALERIDVQMCTAMDQWAFTDSGLKVFIAHGDAYCVNNNPFRRCRGYTIYANPGTTIYRHYKSKSRPISEAPVK